MPTYVYYCVHCGDKFEVFQPYVEDAYKRCKVCGSDDLRKEYKPAGIIYKGSGFYVNDSRKGTGK